MGNCAVRAAHKTGIATLVLIAGLGAATHFEGKVYSPYQDIAGNWTVCRGHTGPDVKPGQKWTDAECDKAFEEDYSREAQIVLSCVKTPLTNGQQIAFFDFAYNVGGRAFCRSSMAVLVNHHRQKQACAELQRWVYVGKINCRTAGNKCSGIVKRRDWEYQKCMEN